MGEFLEMDGRAAEDSTREMMLANNSRQIIWGWNPEQDENHFVVSPSRFCVVHRLSPCQAGVIRYLSRYHFEKNPWLVKQSVLLLDLMLAFGESSQPWSRRLLRRLGLPLYMAPRLRRQAVEAVSVSTYCALNGISSQLMLPLNLVCDTPTRDGLNRARAMLLDLLGADNSGSASQNRTGAA